MYINLEIPILSLYNKDISWDRLHKILKRHFNVNGFSERHYHLKNWSTSKDYYASMQLTITGVPYVDIRIEPESKLVMQLEPRELEQWIKNEGLWRN